MKRVLFGAIASGMMILSSAAAHAATTVYNDRASFEAALSSFTVDDYSDIVAGSVTTLTRPGYTLTGSLYKCVTTSDCGDNTGIGFDHPGYLWNYVPQTLTFGSAVNAVGMDFGYYGGSTPTTLTLGGVTGPAALSKTFFGIISDTSFTTITYSLSQGSGSLSDNLTFGTAAAPAVPVPASLPLLAAGFGALCLARKRNSKA